MAQEGIATCKYGRDVLIDEISEARNPFSISLSDLQSSFNREVRDICLPEDELVNRTYDEVAVLYGALWTQRQIFESGLSSGSIRVSSGDSKQLSSDILDILFILKIYEAYLQAHDMEASNAAADFARVSMSGNLLGQGSLFSDRYLTYCTALLRAPLNPYIAAPSSDGLLAAQNIFSAVDVLEPGDTSGAFESLELSVLRNALATDLNIHDDGIAMLFFDQLRLLGLCTVSQSGITSRDATTRDAAADQPWYSFTLPLLMDSSPTVELLILAIEVMLDDLDLTLNEQAFNLLVSRAWPSLLCSPHALERLGNAAISWVMAQVSPPFAKQF